MGPWDVRDDDEDEGHGPDGESNSDAFLRQIARVDDVAPPEALTVVGAGNTNRRALREAPLPHQGVAVGDKFGHYSVVALIGKGGMGVVYRAVDELLCRPAALKVLPPCSEDDAERRRRFLREARAAASVNHPNIATIYQVGESNGKSFIAMELVEGKSLARRIREGRLPIDEALNVGVQILRGLRKAHAAGLVHRDLKPDNVMINDDGTVKVLDFGLAKPAEVGEPLGEADTALTDEGGLVGTPYYMSPEQARGKVVDSRSDLFSFGVVLYEMITGKRPFVGGTASDIVSSVLRDDPAALSSIRHDVPPEVERFVERCMEKDPAKRFADARSALSELEPLYNQLRSPKTSIPPLAPDAARSADSGDKQRSRHTADPSVLSNRDSRATPSRGIAASSPGGARDSARRAAPRWAVMFALAVAIVSVLFRVTRSNPVTQPAAGASASAPAKPTATAITDLPLPDSRVPEALVAYKSGLQALRDANWGRAKDNFARAAELDPSMAAAHLRYAYIAHDTRLDFKVYQAAYSRAVELRATLTPRDLMFLRVLEPLLSRMPAERSVVRERLLEAIKTYPMDAELFMTLAQFAETKDEGLRFAERAAALDPQYADAQQLLGRHLARFERYEDALKAFEHCLEVAPTSADCRMERSEAYAKLGRCADAEEELRKSTASQPQLKDCMNRADLMLGLGRSVESSYQIARQALDGLSGAERQRDEAMVRARFAYYGGDFEEALKSVEEFGKLIDADPYIGSHQVHTIWLKGLYVEMGRTEDAVRVVESYWKHKDAWVSEKAWERNMPLSRFLHHAGKLSKADLDARLDEFVRAYTGDDKEGSPSPSLAGYLIDIESREEAEAGLRVLHALPNPPKPEQASVDMLGALARAHLLAGDADQSIEISRLRVKHCYGAFDLPHAWMTMAQALEKKGDKAGACEYYGKVLERWGKARPKSVTADKARDLSRALSCKLDKPAPAPGKGGQRP
ncbi:MAG: protein kinase [Byssovorax sp.]